MGRGRSGRRWARTAAVVGASVAASLLVGITAGRVASGPLADFRLQVPPRAFRPAPLPTYDAQWDWANAAPRPQSSIEPVSLPAPGSSAADRDLLALSETDVLGAPPPRPVRVHRVRIPTPEPDAPAPVEVPEDESGKLP